MAACRAGHTLPPLSKAQRALIRRVALIPHIFEPRLTPCELCVLRWMIERKTNPEIARILAKECRTVDKHREPIYAKLGVGDRPGLYDWHDALRRRGEYIAWSLFLPLADMAEPLGLWCQTALLFA